MSSATLDVHLVDEGGFEVTSYPTSYAPFVRITLADGVALYLRDLDTCHALGSAVEEARSALLAIVADRGSLS